MIQTILTRPTVSSNQSQPTEYEHDLTNKRLRRIAAPVGAMPWPGDGWYGYLDLQLNEQRPMVVLWKIEPFRCTITDVVIKICGPVDLDVSDEPTELLAFPWR